MHMTDIVYEKYVAALKVVKKDSKRDLQNLKVQAEMSAN